jgi:hypothetical protein
MCEDLTAFRRPTPPKLAPAAASYTLEDAPLPRPPTSLARDTGYATAKGAAQIRLAGAEHLHFAPLEDDAGLEPIAELVVEARAPVCAR